MSGSVFSLCGNKNGILAAVKGTFLVSFFVFGLIFSAKPAEAYTRTDYKATLLIQSAEKLELSPGGETTFRVGFKNSGAAPWSNAGANFVSVYTYNPKYRKSSFQGTGWYKYNQPVKLKEASVAAGQIGYIEFKIKAPQTAGAYTESFYLAAEDKAWIEGGQFNVPITVSKSGTAVTPSSSPLNKGESGGSSLSSKGESGGATLIPTATSNFQAALLLKSYEKINAKAGELIDVRLGYKNTGLTAWEIRGLVVPSEDLEDDGNSIFYTPTWTSGHQAAAAGDEISPGRLGFVDFKLKVPDVAGTYTAKFKLVANYSYDVSGSEVEIPVYVTDESGGADESGSVSNILNMQEPTVKVGLYYNTSSDNNTVELSGNGDYQIFDKNGAVLANLNEGEPVDISYNFSSKIYKIINARLSLSTEGDLEFKGVSDGVIFTLLSYSRPDGYGHNDNKYRDGIILHYVDTTGRMWVINRLPLEHYLYGIAETGNGSPLEYIKSIIVASRTYALYHYLNPYKYNGHFTLQTTTADQLYRGYNSELRRPRVVQAVDATKGQAITYGGNIVVTPYFGHSDGKTRSWPSVFGGKDKAWLQPVSTPYDSGMTLWGHGVGMSANDAYGHAKTDLWNYTKILKYYYNGIEVSKVY